MLRTSPLARSASLAFLAVNLLLGAAWAQKETVLHSFAESPDGDGPYYGALVLDKKGNLYGTTITGGGASGAGTIFKVTPSGKEKVLYSFTGGTDGANPLAELVFDTQGNLYGTTVAGGRDSCNAPFGYGCGVVFKLSKAGKEKVLYSFSGGRDGANPYAGLARDAKGNLYGTTVYGGASSNCPAGECGVVFRLSRTGKERVLYSFCSQSKCTDGLFPQGGLVFDAKGNLYGTTVYGGAYGEGTVFKVTPWGKETVLYSFCSLSNCRDGAQPYAGVVFDTAGNLYGRRLRRG